MPPPPLPPSDYTVVVGTLIFTIVWVFITKAKIPFLPIGRTAGTLCGAVLVFVCRILTVEEATDAINHETLFLLFGTMIITALLEREGFFNYVVHFLSWRCTTAFQLLVRVSLVSAVLSALVTNDTVCVFLTPIVCHLCRRNKLPFGPYLISLATSANIGSTATPVGNPQNMIIASLSKITYAQFLLRIGPATVVSVIINIGLMKLMYGPQLANLTLLPEDSTPHDEGDGVIRQNSKVSFKSLHENGEHEHGNEEHIQQQIEMEESKRPSVSVVESKSEDLTIRPALPSQTYVHAWDWACSHKKLVALLVVLLGTIIAFIAGANLGWTAVAGAVIMLCIDFCEPDETFKKVDWGLLVFFTALFIVVRAFQATGLPAVVWDACKDAIILERFTGLALYSVTIIIGGNTVSNVPLVLLLSHSIPLLPDPRAGWLLLSFVSTVAGNLTLIGSVANLIVCERAKQDYILGFMEYLRFGLPSTLVITVIGVALMRAIL